MPIRTCLVLLLIAAAAPVALAQPTTFTYQGRLTDAGGPATGTYDFEFRLFDAASGGMQIGTTESRGDVTVTSGVFSVVLDFGPAAFPGAGRFLEVAVRAGASAGSFTQVLPLQELTSTPYAIRSIDADNADSANALSGACVGCVGATALASGSVTDAKIVTVAGGKIAGTIPVAAIPAGSTSYVQNTTAQQAGANFNVAGTGRTGSTMTATEFNYVAPQSTFYFVSEAAFTSRDGAGVSKGLGTGGAFPTVSTGSGLTAPINLPEGATVTNVRYIYVDNSINSMTMIVSRDLPGSGVYNQLAVHTSAVETVAVQTVDVAASFTVNNSAESFEVVVDPAIGWSDASMVIRGVRITYTMPRPAR